MDSHAIQQALTYFRRFAPLEWDDFAHHCQLFRHQRLPASSSLFTQGAPVKDVVFLLDGVGRYYYVNNDGTERNKSLVGPGGAFASMSSALLGEPSLYSAQTLSQCDTLSIAYDDLVGLS